MSLLALKRRGGTDSIEFHPPAGAMRVLAESFDDPDDLNAKGYALYCEFRPDSPQGGGAHGWGQKAEIKLSALLELRPRKPETVLKDEEEEDWKEEGGKLLKEEEEDTLEKDAQEAEEEQESVKKRPKLELEDEFDSFLNDDLDVSYLE